MVIQVDSFSKIAFPGMRVGWIVAPSNVIDRLRLVKQATDLHTGHLAQAILAEYVRRGLLGRHVERTRKAYSGRLAALEQAARALICLPNANGRVLRAACAFGSSCLRDSIRTNC